MIQLLFVCDPLVYQPWGSETPELYQAVSRSRGSSGPPMMLYHADPAWIHDDVDDFRVTRVPLDLTFEQFRELSQVHTERIDLADLDLAFCRTLKPFPCGYMARLSELESHIRFVNSPKGIIRHLQPDFLPTVAGGWVPELLITRDAPEACRFLDRFGSVVCKQPESCGGKGVTKVWREDDEVLTNHVSRGSDVFDDPIEAFEEVFQSHPGEFQVVRFLKNIDRGDKRVLVVDQQIVGAYLRKSASDGWVHNIAAGGNFFPTTVGDRERQAIAATAGVYAHMGVSTLGYDFLVDDDGTWMISEINAGNVAGYSMAATVGYPDAQRALIHRLHAQAQSSRLAAAEGVSNES